MLENILNKTESISVVGLGYVGMPLAVSFAKKVNVIGFDINKSKIDKYKSGIDVTNEVGNEALKTTKVQFTSDEKLLKESRFHIIAVPTPINSDTTPDLTPVIKASELVGRNLRRGAIVVYESTVYPGVTEEICAPILERESGMKCGVDFKVGYSPERINPGDKVNTLEKIIKIVSGMDKDSLDIISSIYELIIEAGVYRAESIKVAEAAKVIENSQRDINIAFMNELSMVFDRMGINTKAVLDAASTKWNFLRFTPGLVGGHCIGVDPYYFVYKAEQLGYHSQIILSGRKINDDMPKFVVDSTIRKMIEADIKIKDANVLVLGLTFKENCPDIRNSKVIDIINGLKEYGINIFMYDPIADEKEVYEKYLLEFCDYKKVSNLDAIILAVPHKEFSSLLPDELANLYKKDNKKVLIDIKGVFNKDNIGDDYLYWSL